MLGRRSLFVGMAAATPLALTVASAPARAATENTLDTMLSNRTLRVGWIIDPPGSAKDPKTGDITGYYIDIVKFILAQVNVKPEFVETKWSTFPAGLQSRQLDILAGGTFASISRAAAVSFTQPIFYLGYTAAARKGDNRFKSLADIDKPGIKVAVVQGSGGHEFVKRVFKHASIVALDAADLVADLVEVQAGRADVAIEDAWTTQRYIAVHPELVNLFAARPFNIQPIAWPMRRDDHSLRQFFDTALSWMSINGKIDEIIAGYPASSRFVIDVKYRQMQSSK